MPIQLERRICIEHQFLDSNIKVHLLEKIKKTILNECTKDYGYILDVKRIIKINDNYISNANCDIIFSVLFEVENLKPENGKQFKGEVCMIFGGGIFINIKNKQKVLIPITNLKDYTYNQSEKTFKKGSKIIKENDVLELIITGTKYSKQKFSCFGNLVEI
jgi:DNA-directed RNA polymerase subunit E'/Rpb7